MTLQRSMIYRIAYNVTLRAIAGRPCTFLRYVDRAFDVTRAEVDVDGQLYLVRPSLLIRF